MMKTKNFRTQICENVLSYCFSIELHFLRLNLPLGYMVIYLHIMYNDI